MDKEVELLLTGEPQRMLQSKISAISDQCTLMQQANGDLETKVMEYITSGVLKPSV